MKKRTEEILVLLNIKCLIIEGGSQGGGGEGGITVIHILIGMFNSNPMITQYYLNNNLT